MGLEALAYFDLQKSNIEKFDVIILGTGIAGLFTALSLDKKLSVLLVTKDKIAVNNTNLAQGGIAVTLGNTSLDKHKQDTIVAGNYYNSQEVVEDVISHGSKFVDHLLKYGVNFDTDEDGNLLLTREGGHTERRILHSKDSTGQEMVRALSVETLKRPNIQVRENTFAIDTLVEDGRVKGLVTLDEVGYRVIYGNSVVIATGGIGRLYKKSTNEIVCTGDGMAIASRAGALLKDMEFVQFHPTALNIEEDRSFLISEAVRGEGGILRNSKGQAFMEAYHPLKDLAPRNVASLAIHEQMKVSNDSGVFLDITHLEPKYIKDRFPMIYGYCFDKGIDITKEFIPVTPVQHYMMGGVVTNSYGETSVDNLYACGEVANTGMHGANRMASNSLLEGLAFAGIIADRINNNSDGMMDIAVRKLTIPNKLLTNDVDMLITQGYRDEIRRIMSDNVGMIRNKRDLMCALKAIKKIEAVMDRVIDLDNVVPPYADLKMYFEVRNMVRTAKLIIIGALNRPFSLGGHVMTRGV